MVEVLYLNKKRLSRNKILNCFFPILFLLLKGRLSGVLWAWPFHFLGMTKAGRLIHFKTTKRKDTFQPLFFEGYVEILRYPFIPSKYMYFGFLDGAKLYRKKR